MVRGIIEIGISATIVVCCFMLGYTFGTLLIFLMGG